MNKPALDTTISATLVAEDQRLNFLPRFFGEKFMMIGERAVFDWMGRLCPDYNGGYWNFYTLSNGGFYMAPKCQSAMKISVDGNGFDGEISADAAGIVTTIFALDYLANRTNNYRYVDLMDSLKDYAFKYHPEAGLIYRAID